MYKLEIITHSGQQYEIEVEAYDAIILNEQINNSELITILIGNKIFSRIDIKYVGEIEKVETV